MQNEYEKKKKVLWNSEMDLCIGLSTEMDSEEFIEEAMRSHEDLSGDPLPIEDCIVSQGLDGVVWKIEVNYFGQNQ